MPGAPAPPAPAPPPNAYSLALKPPAYTPFEAPVNVAGARPPDAK